MEQKALSHEDVQLAHHLVNELFRMLGTRNPWLYQAQGASPIAFSVHPELWQGSPYGPAQRMVPGWVGPPCLITFGQGVIPIH